MSTSILPDPRTESTHHRRASVFSPVSLPLATPDRRDSGTEQHVSPFALKTSATRHWASLQEHADHMHTGSPGESGAGWTPSTNIRREGFSWDASGTEGQDASRKPSNTLVRQSHSDPRQTAASSHGTESLHGLERSNTSPSISEGIVRTDTSISSVSSLAIGAKRRMQDLSMFGQPKAIRDRSEIAPSSEGPKESYRRMSKVGRMPTFRLSSVVRKPSETEEEPKRGRDVTKPNSPGAPKGNLKDRRNIGQTNALKLTLPIEMPNLPPRQRTPITPNSMRDLAPPRSRSPKTPWARDAPISWLSPHTNAYPTILEGSPESEMVRSHIPTLSVVPASEPPSSLPTPKHTKTRKGRYDKSDSSQPSTPRDFFGLPSPTSHTSEDLKELGKRSRRWRWSGHVTSSDLDSPVSLPTPSADRSSFPRLRNIFKRDSSSSLLSTKVSRKKNLSRPQGPLSEMAPAPPPFVPPGLHRVPTPPMLDEDGEVKEQLGQFFLDFQGDKRPRMSPNGTSGGGVWDSDAILMSMTSNVLPTTSSDEEEPPLGILASPTSPSNDDDPKLDIPITPGEGYAYPPLPVVVTPTSPSSPAWNAYQESWFRVRLKDEIEEQQQLDSLLKLHAEERAKFEWLIPEHLPNSPLCPVHAKYQGPSKGFCAWHGAKREMMMDRPSPVLDLQSLVLDAGAGSPNLNGIKNGKGKKRRLISFSSGSGEEEKQGGAKEKGR